MTPQLDRLMDFVKQVTEWTAKFPLKGHASDEDKSAATELYCCCEGAAENLWELQRIITSLASAENYVCDDEVFPQKITFANGRIVSIAHRTTGDGCFLTIERKKAIS